MDGAKVRRKVIETLTCRRFAPGTSGFFFSGICRSTTELTPRFWRFAIAEMVGAGLIPSVTENLCRSRKCRVNGVPPAHRARQKHSAAAARRHTLQAAALRKKNRVFPALASPTTSTRRTPPTPARTSGPARGHAHSRVALPSHDTCTPSNRSVTFHARQRKWQAATRLRCLSRRNLL